MKIAYILSGKNGITSFTFRELELLETKGINFFLCFTQLKSSNNPPKSNWKFSILNLSLIIIAFFKHFPSLLFRPLLREALKNGEIKVLLSALAFHLKLRNCQYRVHVQMADHKLLIGYYLAKIGNRAKLTCTIHAHELYSEMRYQKFTRLVAILNSCERIFTISEYNRKIIVGDLNVNPQKVKVMRLYPSFSADLNFKHKTIFLVTANWEVKKGYEEIIEAVQHLEREDFVVLVAGRNVNPAVDLDLTALVKENNLGGKILLLGHLNMSMLKVLYSVCDVFILPSKTDYYPDGRVKEREGIPVSLMEAMSYGLPVISTIHAGIPELVKDYLIEEGDYLSLCRIMNYMIDNLNQVKKDSDINVKIISEYYSEKNVDALVSELTSI